MNQKRTVKCHQYATGRGDSGYGFVEYSRFEKDAQNPTYHFSLAKGMGLRFSQLTDDSSAVMEVEPAGILSQEPGSM